MRLRIKLSLLIVAIVLVGGGATTLLASNIMQGTLEEELEKRGVVIAQTLADHVTRNVIDGEIVAAREALREIVQRTEGVEFAYIVGFDSNVFAHTFEDGFPRDLLPKNHDLITTDNPRLEGYATEEGPGLLVGYPLIEGMKAHLHIGLSQAHLYKQLESTRNQIVGAALIIALLAVSVGIVLSLSVTRPLEQLSEAMRVYGEKGVKEGLGLSGGGREVAALARSFDQMTERLKSTTASRDELEKEIAVRRKAEEEARLLAAFPSENPNPVLRAGEDGVLVFANEASAPVLQTWGVGVGDSLPAEWQSRSKAARDAGFEQRVELVCGERVFEITVAPLKERGEVNLYGLDVTARSQAERAFEAERDRARSYLHIAGSIILVLDADGRVELINRRGCEILGYPEDDIRGKPWFESFLPVRMRKDVRAVFDSLMAGEIESVEYFEYPVVAVSGEERLIAWHRSLLRESGKTVGVLSSGGDITERRKAEEDLKDYLRELEQANIRLKEMDQLKSIFLASMSHELRTPLNSIIGFTGVILMGIAGEINEEQRRQLGMVKNSANHLLSLINDILDISKIEANMVELSLEEVGVGDVVEEVMGSLSPGASEKGLEVVTEVPEGITVFSDRRRIKQVLMNLVSNAVKFTDLGSVRIAARATEDDNLEVRVIDTGVGIREEDMNRLFQPFLQIDLALTKKREGTGLGLYLSRKLASLLKADISAKSEYGKGSEFTFIVPLRYEEQD